MADSKGTGGADNQMLLDLTSSSTIRRTSALNSLNESIQKDGKKKKTPK